MNGKKAKAIRRATARVFLSMSPQKRLYKNVSLRKMYQAAKRAYLKLNWIDRSIPRNT